MLCFTCAMEYIDYRYEPPNSSIQTTTKKTSVKFGKPSIYWDNDICGGRVFMSLPQHVLMSYDKSDKSDKGN